MLDLVLRKLKVAKPDFPGSFCVANRHRAPLEIFAPKSQLFSFLLIDGRFEIVFDMFREAFKSIFDLLEPLEFLFML